MRQIWTICSSCKIYNRPNRVHFAADTFTSRALLELYPRQLWNSTDAPKTWWLNWKKWTPNTSSSPARKTIRTEWSSSLPTGRSGSRWPSPACCKWHSSSLESMQSVVVVVLGVVSISLCKTCIDWQLDREQVTILFIYRRLEVSKEFISDRSWSWTHMA